APESPQLLALFGGQPVLPLPSIAIRLRDPVTNRLRRRLKLARHALRIPSAAHQRDELPPHLRWVRGTTLWHRELLFPRKGSGVHETGGTSPRSGTRHVAPESRRDHLGRSARDAGNRVEPGEVVRVGAVRASMWR